MPSTLISCGHIVKCGCKGTNFCVILQIFHGKFVPLHPILRKRLMQDIRNIAIIAHVDHGKTTYCACRPRQDDARGQDDAGRKLVP